MLSSVSIETQLSIAPERTPGSIAGRVILKNVLSLDAPRLSAASSVLTLIWYSMAELERMV